MYLRMRALSLIWLNIMRIEHLPEIKNNRDKILKLHVGVKNNNNDNLNLNQPC